MLRIIMVTVKITKTTEVNLSTKITEVNLSTKITDVNLYAFVYIAFHEDFSPIIRTTLD